MLGTPPVALLPPVAGVPPLPAPPLLPEVPPVGVPPPAQGGLSHLHVPLSQRGAVTGQRLLQSPHALLLYLMSVQVPEQTFWLVSQHAQLLVTQ